MGNKICVGGAETEVGEIKVKSHEVLDSGHVRLHGLAKHTDVDKVFEVDDKQLCRNELYAKGKLSITVLGASGDLAKKKTFPSLMDLFHHNFLPHDVVIMGFARSAQTTSEFRAAIRPWLLKEKEANVVDKFLDRCEYFQGKYDNAEDFAKLNTALVESENKMTPPDKNVTNRMFYFAIPPDAFLSSAQSIKKSALCSGFNRLIVEKPFGHDLVTAEKLAKDLGNIFTEDHTYRIDHYLGKEIIQNLMMFRFGNRFLEPLWNNKHIESVRITFKEDFGTEGRGGYFTNYGIIRDIMQNHLMQVLSVMAMEEPKTMLGKEAGNAVRDAKVAVIKALADIKLSDVVVGQYVGANGKPGYLEDDSIKDKAKAEYVPTFAALVLYINNDRWKGVPFMIKAGKALDERKAEIRVQFKDAVGANTCYKTASKPFPRNELVMRLQPNEVIYMKAIVKTPGLSTEPLQTELDLSYKKRFKGAYMPEAYTRLILEALRGHQSDFVRGDEIVASWKKFDPMIKELEEGKGKQKPLPYPYGSRGPEAADKMFGTKGFVYSGGYDWKDPNSAA